MINTLRKGLKKLSICVAILLASFLLLAPPAILHKVEMVVAVA